MMDHLIDDFVFITHQDAGENRRSEPQHLAELSEVVDDLADELWPVNKKIHDHPELGFKEYIAHEALTKFLGSQAGWKVTPSAYGMETAWVAVFDSGAKGPVVSFNVEMDALEGIGHACGHNLIASASVAGGLATAEMMKRHKIGGKVVVFGTPAEEGGGGKIKLLEAGAYREHRADINLISHPGIVKNSALMRTAAYAAFRVEYLGREAHAAASPWEGINALDALVVAYTALSVLRQQTMPGDVIQGNITDGGARPNIIHAHAAGNFVVRADTQARRRALRAKVDACFLAAATATGATLRTAEVQSYADHVPNRPLGAAYTRYFNALGSPEDDDGDDDDDGSNGPIPENPDVDEAGGRTMASTDQGDVSYAMPSLSPSFAIPAGPGGAGPHNPGFAVSAGTRLAFGRSLRVGKALAGVALDVLESPALLEEVKRAWRREVGGKK
ncbi:hypothetical protein GGR56DRAFT_59019 [Xylariaceae sp. FL0804]|nr:hypothetical protein GGR56DRAFT_59019 [Xylariaceae sp. FL0804]